jgi:LDH2 family malate/lactate/ureidoglycolate dehydrogenase
MLLPLGGGRGAGLAVVATMLSGGLAGGKLPHQKTRSAASECSEHLLMAIDIAHFTDIEKFQSRAADLRETLRNSPADDASQPVRAPGDRALREEAERRERGIPFHRSDIESLSRWAGKLKVEVPWQTSP